MTDAFCNAPPAYVSRYIVCNAIAPGGIETDMLKELPREVYEGAKQFVPLKHFGEVKDIADLMEYLVGANYVTGQTISPNGGVIMPA